MYFRSWMAEHFIIESITYFPCWKEAHRGLTRLLKLTKFVWYWNLYESSFRSTKFHLLDNLVSQSPVIMKTLCLFCHSLLVSTSYTTVFQIFTDVAQPSWKWRDLVAILSKTGLPPTGCSWRSPTNNMFRDPNYSSPPNNSSSLKCMYDKLRLETMDISSMMNNFT